MNRITATILILSLVIVCHAQNRFQTVVGKGAETIALSVVEVSNGYIIGGFCNNNSGVVASPKSNMTFLSLGHDGGLNNSRILGLADPLTAGLQLNAVFDIKKLKSSEGFIAVGDAFNIDLLGIEPLNQDVALIKLSKDGSNYIWARQIGQTGTNSNPLHDQALTVIETADQGYAVAGTQTDSTSGATNPFVFKTDVDGNPLFMYKFATSAKAAMATSLIENSKAELIIAGGGFYPDGLGGTDIMFWKADKTNLKQVSALGTINDEMGIDIITSSDGFHYLLANTDINSANPNIALVKLRDDLTPEWVRIMGTPFADSARALVRSQDGGFVISGTTLQPGPVVNGPVNSFLLKLDEDGNIEGAYIYGGSKREEPFSVITTSDGGYLSSGFSNSFGHFGLKNEMFIVKTDEDGQTGCQEDPLVFNPYGNFLNLGGPSESFVADVFNNDAFTPVFEPLVIADSAVCSQEILRAYAGKDTMICAGQSVSIGDTIIGGVKPLNSVTWSPDYNITGTNGLKQIVTPLVDTCYVLEVEDGAGTTVTDTVCIRVLPSATDFTGLDTAYCSSSPMDFLVPDVPGGWFEGPGVQFNGSDWYFDPASVSLGAGSFTTVDITYRNCPDIVKTTKVKKAPCIDNVIKDSTGGSIAFPQGIFTQCDGQIFVSEETKIVKIDTFGATATVAGDTIPGYADGHVSSEGLLNKPAGLAVSPSGIVYFVDNANHAIRMVRNDTLYTIVGDPPPTAVKGKITDTIGSEARLASPFGLCLDPTGEKFLYITEQDPDAVTYPPKVYQVELTSGKYRIKHLAGGGAINVTNGVKGKEANFGELGHIIASERNLYFTDADNKVIYNYDLLSDSVFRYAGVYNPAFPSIVNGDRLTSQFIFPVGISITCSGNLYVTERKPVNVVREIKDDQVSNYWITNLDDPTDLSVFVRGFLDIANTGDNTIKRLTITDWDVGPWRGLDPDFTYCMDEPADTLNPVFPCGSYFGPGTKEISPGIYTFNPSELGVGVHTIGYNYQVGYCWETKTVDIRIVPDPFVDLPDTTGICGSEALLEPLVVVPNDVSYLWDNGDTNTTTTVNSSGYHGLTVMNLNGCTSYDSTLVITRAAPTLDPGVASSICLGQSVTLGGSPTTDASNFVYWFPTSTLNDSLAHNPVATPVADGLNRYYVYVRDEYNCENLDSVDITVHPLPPASISSPDSTICPGKSTDLTAIGGVNYSWSTGQSGSLITVTPAATTTYQVTMEDANSCVDSANIEVIVHPGISVDVTADVNPLCPGDNTDLHAVVTNGTPVFNYSWSPGSYVTQDVNVSPSSTTEYFVTVTDDNNCEATDSLTLDVAVLVASVSPSSGEICQGESLQLEALPAAATSYSWAGDAGLDNYSVQNPVFTPSGAGDHTFYVTVTSGTCSDSASVNIKVNPYPSITITSPDSTICPGASTSLTASGGVLYSWSTGQSGATVSVNPAATSTYWVTVVDSKTCSDSSSLEIIVHPEVLANVSADVNPICPGDSTDLHANVTSGTPSYGYAWNTGESTKDIRVSPSAATTYVVTVTDDFACQDTGLLTLGVSPLVATASPANGAICEGETIQLSAGPPTATSYSWAGSAGLDDNNIREPVFTPAGAGSYDFYVTVTSGTCSDSASLTITVNPTPVASVNAAIVNTCPGDQDTLSGSGGVSSSTYSWTLPGGGNYSGQNYVINSVSYADTGLYTLTVTNPPNCSDDTTMRVVMRDIDIDIDSMEIKMCEGETPQITVVGSSAYTYSWNPSTFLSSASVKEPVVNGLLFDTRYTVVATDPMYGCTDTDSLMVLVSTGLTAFAGNNVTICTGDNIMLGGAGPPVEPLTAENGAPPYSYTWSPLTNLMDENTGNPTATVSSPVSYYLTVTDDHGCTDQDTISINTYSLPTADAGPNDTICYGFSDTIGGNPTGFGTVGPYTYSWQPATGLESDTAMNPLASPVSTTVYSVLVTDTNGCTATDDMELFVLDEITVNTNDTSVCLGDTVQLLAQGGINYSWQPSTYLDNTTVADPVAIPDSSISYQVIVSSGSFCPDQTLNVDVTVLPLPDVVTTGDTSINWGVTIPLTANGGAVYNWSPETGLLDDPSTQNPLAKPLESIWYVVTVTNEHGCVSTDSVFVDVSTDILEIFVPEAFTPNNDQQNDELCVYDIGFAEFNLRIFNRWGELVFETSDKTECWDGTFNGEEQQIQTFGYILKAVDYNGKEHVKTGTISIVK